MSSISINVSAYIRCLSRQVAWTPVTAFNCRDATIEVMLQRIQRKH